MPNGATRPTGKIYSHFPRVTIGDRMTLPQPDRFSIEDVAARWGKSVSYVQDLTRRRLLPVQLQLIHILPGMKGVKWKCYITRTALETFERTCTDPPVLAHGVSVKEYAATHKISEKTVRRYIKAKKVRAMLTPGGRYTIFE